eukprot:scaffold228415_cov31-Tisochrysis_lutea.AAC.1
MASAASRTSLASPLVIAHLVSASSRIALLVPLAIFWSSSLRACSLRTELVAASIALLAVSTASASPSHLTNAQKCAITPVTQQCVRHRPAHPATVRPERVHAHGLTAPHRRHKLDVSHDFVACVLERYGVR